MGIIKDIRSYISEDEFKITILKDKVNIVNYTSIGHFDENKVIIKYSEGQITVKGFNLVVSRLMDDEILISGNFNAIEFRWYY